MGREVFIFSSYPTLIGEQTLRSGHGSNYVRLRTSNWIAYRQLWAAPLQVLPLEAAHLVYNDGFPTTIGSPIDHG